MQNILSFGDAFRAALGELGPEAQLDVGCALVCGAFEVTYRVGQGVDVTLAGGQCSLVQFLKSWPDKLGQLDKWSFCLTTAKMAVEQERR